MAVPHPPPLPSLIADTFASLSLLALSVAFGRPETTNTRALPRTLRRRRTTAMTAASASAPDSDGLDSLDESLGRGGARKPSFPSPAAAVIAFERAVTRQLPGSAAVGRPAATMASGQ